MAVLDMIKKVKSQVVSFSKHPCKDLDIENKIYYLNGLALIMNEDSHIDKLEEEYLSILINSLELDSDVIDDFIEFSKNPDETAILEIFNSFITDEVKYIFLLDCMMIAHSDGDFSNSEILLIEQYVNLLDIKENIYIELKNITNAIVKKDGDTLCTIFKNEHLIRRELIEYIIKFYDIEVDKYCIISSLPSVKTDLTMMEYHCDEIINHINSIRPLLKQQIFNHPYLSV